MGAPDLKKTAIPLIRETNPTGAHLSERVMFRRILYALIRNPVVNKAENGLRIKP